MARLSLLGVEVDALTMRDLHRLIEEAVGSGKKLIIANHNLHSVYLYHTDPGMRAFYKGAHYVHIDGMPLVLWGRLKKLPLRAENRITYVDWVKPLLKEAALKGWRVFYLGGKPGVAARAAVILKAEIPDLQIGTHHGYFDLGGEENERVVREINNFSPHILLVGMGMPRQEKWILANCSRVKANVFLPAGACFDYVAGAIPTPPRWLGKLGFEWLYRLLAEPRRLWRRYLLEPLSLLPIAVKDLLGAMRENAHGRDR